MTRIFVIACVICFYPQLARGADHPATTAYFDAIDALETARHQQALQSIDKLISLSPQDGNAYWFKGVILLFDHQPQQALACLDQAARLSGSQGDFVLVWRKAAFIMLGDQQSQSRIIARNDGPDTPNGEEKGT